MLRPTPFGFSLPRLEAMGFSASAIDTRVIREVSKIANYWRICRSLAHLSRSYRVLFARLRLETLEHYEPSPTLGMKLKRFVHTEVQMAVFSETSSLDKGNRVYEDLFLMIESDTFDVLLGKESIKEHMLYRMMPQLARLLREDVL